MGLFCWILGPRRSQLWPASVTIGNRRCGRQGLLQEGCGGAFCHLLGESLSPWSGPLGHSQLHGGGHHLPSTPMTPGSEAFSWGAESLCLAPASWEEGRRPLQRSFHTPRKNKAICKPRGGRWGLGKWAGREECPLPAEMVWEGWDPAPSLSFSRALLQRTVFCWMDREAPGRVGSSGTL